MPGTPGGGRAHHWAALAHSMAAGPLAISNAMAAWGAYLTNQQLRPDAAAGAALLADTKSLKG